MKKWIWLLLAPLSACGEDQAANNGVDSNFSYGFHYDAIDTMSNTNLRVRYSSVNTAALQPIDVLVQRYQKLAACMGMMPVDGPLIIFVDSVAEVPHDNASGAYYHETKTAILVPESFNHEMVHHFLNISGFPYADNHNHNSPFFATCGIATKQPHAAAPIRWSPPRRRPVHCRLALLSKSPPLLLGSRPLSDIVLAPMPATDRS